MSSLLFCCHPVDNRDTSQFKLEMEDRKLQRITEGQLVAFASKMGKILLDSVQKRQNDPFLFKVDSSYGIKIYALEIDKIDKGGKLFEIAEAYIYNQQNNIVSEDNLQKEGDSILFYTRPLISNSSLSGIYIAKIDKKKFIKKYSDKKIQFEF
ncbi:MAG: hypothetical protein ACKVOU_02590 [Cytophagales bacterium]